MTYSFYDDEVNPAVGFDEDAFMLRMPFVEVVGDNELELVKIEINFLKKQEIMNQFEGLFDFIMEDLQETDELAESYETEDEEKELTYSIYVNHEENKFELSLAYARGFGVYEYPLYDAVFDANTSQGELYNEMIEGSSLLFHDELMKLAGSYKSVFDL
ncbi:hypothetical protein [Pradoshia sp.]